MERLITASYDEEDWPGVVLQVVKAVHEISAASVDVDARIASDEACPDFWAILVADHPVSDSDIVAALDKKYR